MLRNNKKGFVQDLIFFGIVLLVISIVVIIGSKMFTDVNTNYQSSDAKTISKTLMSDSISRFNSIFDYIFFTILVIFALALFVGVFMLDSHPAFYFVGVITLAFALIVMGIIGNVYEEFSTNDDVVVSVSNFNLINTLMDNYITIFVVIGFIMIILLYTKFKVGY